VEFSLRKPIAPDDERFDRDVIHQPFEYELSRTEINTLIESFYYYLVGYYQATQAHDNVVPEEIERVAKQTAQRIRFEVSLELQQNVIKLLRARLMCLPERLVKKIQTIASTALLRKLYCSVIVVDSPEEFEQLIENQGDW
jgi:hypothetical protein